MFYAFRHFLNKSSNLKSALGTATTIGVGTHGLLWLTQHFVEKYVPDPREKEIILKHFMDVDACQAALNRHRYLSNNRQ